MSRRDDKRHIGFAILIAGGLFLALVLLVQTVGTYVYVSGNLMRQEALQEAGRWAAALERGLRRAGSGDTAALAAVLTDFRSGSERVAWLRLIDAGGEVIAFDGEPAGDPTTFARFRQTIGDGEPAWETRETSRGPVLVSVSPVRLDASPDGVGRAFALLETAIDLDTFSAAFLRLRANLIIGVSAALALLGTLVVIKLRFPRYLHGKQLESQVRMARSVQENLLPKARPWAGDADIAAVCRPAWDAGGDFYDVFNTDEGRLALILGDVAGKGIAAAPLMGFIHGAAHASAWTESTHDHETATRRLNELVWKKTAPERFVSMFWSYFDRSSSTLRYVNAGHLPALLLRQEGGGIRAARLGEGGPVLGVVPRAAYTQGYVQVEPGDVLVVFSDGVSEAEDDFGAEFGDERILDAVVGRWTEPAEQMRDAVLSAVREFRGPRGPEDDCTLIVIRFEHSRLRIENEEPEAVHA